MENETKYEMEEEAMDNRTNIDDFLTVRGFNGGWGYNNNCNGDFANPSANAIRLDRNNNAVRDEADCTRSIIGTGIENLARDNAFATVNGNITGANMRTSDTLSSLQLNLLREQADIARQLAVCCCESKVTSLELAAKNAECCCETQKLVISENQKTRDLISENALRTAVDANNVSATVSAINSAASQNTSALIQAIREMGNGHRH